MAILPWVLPRPSEAGLEFFKEVKETGEVPQVVVRDTMVEGDVENRLTKLAGATSSGLGAEKINLMMIGLRRLKDAEERRFQYMVTFAARPISLQIILRRKSREMIELEIMSDPQLVNFAKESQLDQKQASDHG